MCKSRPRCPTEPVAGSSASLTPADGDGRRQRDGPKLRAAQRSLVVVSGLLHEGSMSEMKRIIANVSRDSLALLTGRSRESKDLNKL